MNQYQRTVLRLTRRYSIARSISYQDSRAVTKSMLRYSGLAKLQNLVDSAERSEQYRNFRMRRWAALREKKEALITHIDAIKACLEALRDDEKEPDSAESVRCKKPCYRKLLRSMRLELSQTNSKINELNQFEKSISNN